MNIAYLTTDFGIPVCGNKGASIHVRELSSALSNLGHSVEILTSRSGGEVPDGFTVPVREYRLEPQERRKISALKNEPTVAEPMVKEIRSMMYAANLRYRVLPHLLRYRPDALYERYSLMGTAGCDIAKSLGIPHVLEVNAPLSEEHARFRGSAFPDTIRRTEQQILTSADEVIAVSEPLREWIISSGVSPDRVTVVPNGVDTERFSSANNLEQVDPGFDARPVVGFVGTLKGWHGTSTLIQAIGSIARQRGIDRCPHLLIVGDGPEREHLETVARYEGVAELVTFTGSIPHERIPSLIAAMDIAVAPYDAAPDFYFSPLKLFEYMAAGKPVVAAAIGQIQDCIKDGVTGLLYPPGDIDALASRIVELIDNPDRAKDIGYSARNETVASRSWKRNAEVVVDLISRQLSLPDPASVTVVLERVS